MTAKTLILSGAICLAFVLAGIYAMTRTPQDQSNPQPAETTAASPKSEIATFGGGCFWCTEAVFQQLKGVQRVTSGYSGGHVPNPTYKDICTGTTGHAEVIQIAYDAGQVSFDELLEVFWTTHDPTTPNQQGNDFGPQYRSVVFYHNDQQRELAERYKAELDASGAFPAPIVTEISPFEEFFPAEDYHQRYYEQNPDQMYCRFVIGPKLEKLQKVFRDKLKDSAE